MLEVSGIPRCDEENVEDLLINLFTQIGIQVHSEDIEAAHRVSARETANVIVMFKSRKLRNLTYQKRSLLRNISSKDIGIASRPPNKIYINESLTRLNKDLFYKALMFKKENGFKFLWTRNGTIHLKKDESARSVIIKHERDLPV